ncbi:adenosylcobinamide amidohydrolase [Thiocapsa bogorovii]|uniref:adenosylcobinamide amidohydrolase n=1 Tax=Thiocapsa bogorovii TaxID=521689 RepID=UPI001E46B7D3|nr:adenosylcobinamide amidohydrolase [Thiocapsa bogorovii]UHD16033.1 adenosylcobinamide amidohydrolase [Thiocapsa bogorovii]
MLLEETDRYALHRQGRYLVVAFARPHRVLGTCRVNGGMSESLTHLANHQSCEGVAHLARYEAVLGLGALDYHARSCSEAGLPPETTALMGTAANMQCAVVAHASAEDLRATVVATAGVTGNAVRAGDPAAWHEEAEGSRPARRGRSAESADQPGSEGENVHDRPPDESGSGTIVTLVLLNRPCTPACLVRAATMVTEAKSTALLDLRMPSLQSRGLATGTGTDQLAIAAPLVRADEWERHWAGGHNTLGALLGRATHDAVTRCLLLQNGIVPELRRTVCAALSRFGCDEAALRACAESELDAPGAAVFAANLQAIVHDPHSAAAAYGLAEILDLVRAGVLHAEVAREAILNQAALLGAAVAVKPERFVALRKELVPHQGLPDGRLAALAVVRGFARKWD